MRGNIATILPSSNASKSRETTISCGLSSNTTPVKERCRLSVVTSALVLMPCGMLKEVLEVERREDILKDVNQGDERIGERRSKQGAALRHEVSGGEGDFVVKGTFASEDIRRKKSALAKVGEEKKSNLTAAVERTRRNQKVQGASGGGGELMKWMEELKFSDMENSKQGRREVIVNVRDESVERQDDCFREKNIDAWMKELQIEQKRCSPVEVGEDIFDAGDDDEAEKNILGEPLLSSGEPKLDEEWSSTATCSVRDENMPNQFEGNGAKQDRLPVFLMKDGEVCEMKIFIAESPFHMVGRPVDLEKEYQDLLDDLNSYFFHKSHEAFSLIEGVQRVFLITINIFLINQDLLWQPECRTRVG